MLQCRRGHSAWGLLRLFRYAHRGYHDKPRIPENSMAAFRRAIENGFGAELDVHLMKDGRLAVIHDASLKRTAGADVLVEDLTAEELKTYRLEAPMSRSPAGGGAGAVSGSHAPDHRAEGRAGQPCRPGRGHLPHAGPLSGPLLH
ncbi:MAG: glycerophosphodiester phosphodiesterase family protein [Oscillospiraceae bacterium]